MKRWIFACATAASLAAGLPASAGGVATMGAFHEALAPHGEWVAHGTFGSVWRPNVAEVGVGFRPYGTGGRWLYSDVGWAWQSDWDWGWAPFHYGRWILDPVYGWVWIPDTVWGPAWVSWRYGGGYAGWAPLAPAGFVEVDSYAGYWCFVPHNYLLEPNVFHYAGAVDYHQAFAVTTRVNATVTINGATRVWAGPPVGNISQATGHSITPVTIGAPAPGVIQPHTLNGVPAPQVVHAGGIISNHPLNPGGQLTGGGHTGVVPGSPAPAGVANRGVSPTNSGIVGGGRPVATPSSAYGQVRTPANNPTPAQNPAYRAPSYGTQPGGYGQAGNYGYRTQPAPQQPMQRTYPTQTYQQPTYRPAAPAYRPSAPSYRPAAPSHPAPSRGSKR
jgi:hypothetical protein